MSVWVVVVAAGRGRRFGAAKQFAPLGGRPLVQWSLQAARPVADGVVLVLPAPLAAPGPRDGSAEVGSSEERRMAEGAQAVGAGAEAVVEGGDSRADSVRAGLAAVPTGADVIVVHDGARPLATPALFRSVVDAVLSGAEGAVPGVAVGDTLKRVTDGTITATVARQGLVAVQTPQAFRADVLRRAHEGGPDATDDAALVEALGATVRVVPGDPRNLKVTTAADLDVAEALLAAR